MAKQQKNSNDKSSRKLVGIRLEPDVFARLAARAAEEGRSLGSMAARIVKSDLASRQLTAAK